MSPSTGRISSPNEPERLAAVRRHDILDTPPDGTFDRVTRLAARILDVPISVVSIVDHDRIWFKSRHGIDMDQIDREPGLCASAILHDGPWIVADAEVDPRTLTNPLVSGELGLRFYAGVPLRTSDGHNLGTLAVLDTKPREITKAELATLEDLAAVVVEELEVRLVARREGHRLERERADFLMIAAHELRAPLAAVYGAAKLLGGPVRDEESRDKLLGVIADEAERLAGVVGEILTSAKREADGGKQQDERFAPLPVLERVIEAARVNLRDDLELEVVAEGELPVLESDSGKVGQILAGLVENAVKYSPGGGRITVAVLPREGGVRFEVGDHGIGVPPGERERIFEKFVRLGSTEAASVGGTGLGLYIGRELARELGGSLECTGGAGGGSTFVFDLPATPQVS